MLMDIMPHPGESVDYLAQRKKTDIRLNDSYCAFWPQLILKNSWYIWFHFEFIKSMIYYADTSQLSQMERSNFSLIYYNLVT